MKTPTRLCIGLELCLGLALSQQLLQDLLDAPTALPMAGDADPLLPFASTALLLGVGALWWALGGRRPSPRRTAFHYSAFPSTRPGQPDESRQSHPTRQEKLPC